MIKTRELIESIEEDSSILSFSFEGHLVWPVIRFLVIQTILDSSNNLDSPSEQNRISQLPFWKIAVNLIKNNPLYAKPSDVIVFHTTLSNMSANNRNYNRIVDYFIDVLPTKPIIVEEPFQFKHFFPRNKDVYSKLHFMLLQKLFGIGYSRQRNSEATRVIDGVLEFVISKLQLSRSTKSSIFGIKTQLVSLVLGLDLSHKMYYRYLKRHRCKLLVIEDGYYGGDKSMLIKAAKELGVQVFEPQHGFVNANHPAYSFGKGVLANRVFAQYFPDLFLSYGQFWDKSIFIPNDSIVIGNPHLSESIQKLKKLKASKRILVVGSGIAVAETSNLLTKLHPVALRKGFEVYYRPHPQERSSATLRYKEAFTLGVKIDTQELYSSIVESELIIGELSTVMFEAIAFGRKVKIFRSSYTNTYWADNIKYFDSFDLDSLEEIFKEGCFVQGASEYYWTMKWKQNFIQLLTDRKLNIL